MRTCLFSMLAGWMLLGAPVVSAQHPAEVQACLKTAPPGYAIRPNLDPTFLKADFDGDGKGDLAVIVQKRGQSGIVICRSGAPGKADVLGAGTPFHDFKDLDFTSWKMHPKTLRASQGAGGEPSPRLRGDGLLIDWSERGGALMYWNGKRFVWYQQGD